MTTLRFRFLAIVVCIATLTAAAQTIIYENIPGFSTETNSRLRRFMESTKDLTIHKVAVFDCDGTVLGQAPYYMCDEALIDYFTSHHGDDPMIMGKLRVAIDNNTDEIAYAHRMVELLAGHTVKEIEDMGRRCFSQKYPDQIFPEMKQLIQNLKNYGFDVYIVTASHELLYQGVCSNVFGIPTDHIIGVRQQVDSEGRALNKIIEPITVERGKAEAIMSFIKTRPLFAAGNSRGDVEMMKLASDLRLVINPNDTKPVDVLGGATLRQYWSIDPNCIIESCREVPTEGVEWSGRNYKLPVNATHRK